MRRGAAREVPRRRPRVSIKRAMRKERMVSAIVKAWSEGRSGRVGRMKEQERVRMCEGLERIRPQLEISGMFVALAMRLWFRNSSAEVRVLPIERKLANVRLRDVGCVCAWVVCGSWVPRFSRECSMP